MNIRHFGHVLRSSTLNESHQKFNKPLPKYCRFSTRSSLASIGIGSLPITCSSRWGGVSSLALGVYGAAEHISNVRKLRTKWASKFLKSHEPSNLIHTSVEIHNNNISLNPVTAEQFNCSQSLLTAIQTLEINLQIRQINKGYRVKNNSTKDSCIYIVPINLINVVWTPHRKLCIGQEIEITKPSFVFFGELPTLEKISMPDDNRLVLFPGSVERFWRS